MKKITFLLFFIIFIIFISFIYLIFNINPENQNYNTPIPSQEKTKKKVFMFKGFKITPLFKYSVEARILSKKKYNDEHSLSLYDYALGWNKMSNLDYSKTVNVSQRNRWYYWQTFDKTKNLNEISLSSSNHHLIHANNDILEKIKEFGKDDLVKLTGYLVNVDYPMVNRNIWSSSTSRSDTGDGACEILFVENIEKINP